MKLHRGITAGHLMLVLALAAGLGGSRASAELKMEPDTRRNATVRAVEIVLPCVVNIATATVKQYADFYDPIFKRFYGQVRQREELFNIGSGVIIDEDGYILTNLHVMQRATRAQVKLWDGRVYDVDSYAASPGTDLALLKLRTKPGEKFKAIKFAGDNDVLLGETVIALGNPFGLGGSVSQGILSAINRKRPEEDVAPNVQEWLQTDAAINPGNSGGPLVNLNGEFIGVNSAVGEGQGIGFAIPVKQVARSLSELLSPETMDGLWFGAYARLDEDGVLKVSSVQPGGPAERAGLRVGHQILQVDGHAPRGAMEFNRLLSLGREREVDLQVRQGAETRNLKVKLVPFPDLIRSKLGLGLSRLTPEQAAGFRTSVTEGLFLDDVEKNSPADRGQLQRGFLLTAMEGQPTKDLLAVAGVLTAKKSGDVVSLTVVVPRKLENNTIEFRQGTVKLQVR